MEIPPDRSTSLHSWHLYMLRLHLDKLEIDRDDFMRALRQKGIGTSVHFIPIPLHPFFAEHAQLPRNHCPRALEQYLRLVSLPLYPAMTELQVEHVISSVKEIVQENRKTKTVAVATGEQKADAR